MHLILENGPCNHVTGAYQCRPGYTGITCDHPCPFNTFGPNCASKCSCKNGGDCHHVTGNYYITFIFIYFFHFNHYNVNFRRLFVSSWLDGTHLYHALFKRNLGNRLSSTLLVRREWIMSWERWSLPMQTRIHWSAL